MEMSGGLHYRILNGNDGSGSPEVHGKVVGASRCGPASVPRLWEPEPGHPAAKIITGRGGAGSDGGREIEMPDSIDHFSPRPPNP